MQKRIVFGALVAILAVFLGAVGMAFAQVPVTECGQVIPRGRIGELAQDLSCPDAPKVCSDWSTLCSLTEDCPPGKSCGEAAAVYLEPGATLKMNGFTIDGEVLGVRCRPRRCTILGPGTIRAAQRGVAMSHPSRGTRIEISNVLIDGSSGGIASGYGEVSATAVTIQNCLWDGMFAYKLSGSDITVNDNGAYGIWINGGKMIADNVKANRNAYDGIANGRWVMGSNITANLNGGAGIAALRIVATGVETKGNAMDGVVSYRTARIAGLVSMNNGGPGLLSLEGGAMLVDSSLSGNDTSGDGIDILSTRQPSLSNTTCSRSERIICERGGSPCTRTGESWGVCSLD